MIIIIKHTLGGSFFPFSGVKKELLATLKTAIYAELALWRRSVENHLYWVAASSEGDPRMIVPKWLSILNHVRDIHVHSNPLYPVCAHGELQPREWLDDGVYTTFKYDPV